MSYSLDFPHSYIEAKELVDSVLSKENALIFKGVSELSFKPCEIKSYTISEVEDSEDAYSNLTVDIRFDVVGIQNEKTFNVTEKGLTLKLLSPLGDKLWTQRMKINIWDNVYPSTVGVDTESGDVYFVYFTDKQMFLTKHSTLTDSQLESFTYDINDRNPYRIFIDAEAMFSCIDGSEGYRHLRESVYIELNCNVPIRLTNDKKVEKEDE